MVDMVDMVDMVGMVDMVDMVECMEVIVTKAGTKVASKEDKDTRVGPANFLVQDRDPSSRNHKHPPSPTCKGGSRDINQVSCHPLDAIIFHSACMNLLFN